MILQFENTPRVETSKNQQSGTTKIVQVTRYCIHNSLGSFDKLTWNIGGPGYRPTATIVLEKIDGAQSIYQYIDKINQITYYFMEIMSDCGLPYYCFVGLTNASGVHFSNIDNGGTYITRDLTNTYNAGVLSESQQYIPFLISDFVAKLEKYKCVDSLINRTGKGKAGVVISICTKSSAIKK